MPYISAEAFGALVEITPQAVRRHCRAGVFGRHAKRGPRRTWLIDAEPALRAMASHRDLSKVALPLLNRLLEAERKAATRLRPEQGDGPTLGEITPDMIPPGFDPVITWTGPGGSYETPLSVAMRVKAAIDNPDEPRLTADLVEHLDRILEVKGLSSGVGGQ